MFVFVYMLLCAWELLNFQAVCDLLKRSLQTLMEDFAPMSKDVAELLIQMYQTVPHVAILDLTKQVNRIQSCCF